MRQTDVSLAEPRTGSGLDKVRVLYIGGSARSGSTLLDRILGQLPGFWSAGELVHVWRRGVLENQLCGCGVPFHECQFWGPVGREAFGGWKSLDLDELLALQRSVDRNRFIPLMLNPRLSPAYEKRLRQYTQFLTRLYEALRTVSGARIVVDSTKHASYAFLLRQVPVVDMRVVHLVRDSHGVAFSWTKRVQKPEVIQGSAYMDTYHPARMSMRWMTYNLFFHLLRSVGVPSEFVRYEALVQSPLEQVERILAHMGESASPEDLGFIGDGYVELKPTHTVSGNPMRFTEGRMAMRIDEEWRRRMKPHHRNLVSALTWPLLVKYGYGVSRRNGGNGKPGLPG